MNNPKVLFMDIESSPLEALVWGRYQVDTAKIRRESEILSAAWYFKGAKEVESAARANYRPGSDKKVVKALWNALNLADVVVGHNADKFDRRKANAFFAKHGLPPVQGYRVVDTLRHTKANFQLSSYKLGDVCQYFGLGKKIDTGGIDLWDACMRHDKRAFKEMERYNRHDVVLAEKLYNFLLPWINGHPNMALMAGRPKGCPNCGGQRLKSHGLRHNYTQRAVYRRYRCQDCFSLVRGENITKKTLAAKS